MDSSPETPGSHGQGRYDAIERGFDQTNANPISFRQSDAIAALCDRCLADTTRYICAAFPYASERYKVRPCPTPIAISGSNHGSTITCLVIPSAIAPANAAAH